MAMASDTVTLFKPYAFRTGQKIRIEGGKRSGDWEVVAVGDAKVTLRCPISGREFEWARFCYWVEDREREQWPLND